MCEIYRKINELLDKKNRFAIATIVRTEGSTPRNAGTKMIILQNGEIHGSIGGGKPETIVVNESLKAIQDEKPKFLSFRLDEKSDTGLVCGGNMDIFIEPNQREFILLLIGGGHIGKALTKLGSVLGFSITVIDPAATKEQFPDAAVIISKDGINGLSNTSITPSTCIVIATGSHETDEQVLRKVLDSKVSYLGMIGSRNKIRIIFNKIIEEGTPKEKLMKIHAPIGLDIGSETPSEIALSIIAEIISVLRGGSGSPLSKKEAS